MYNVQPILRPAPCEFYPDKPGFDLVADWDFYVGGKRYTVPAGFWFDGASVPPMFWQYTYSPFDPRILADALGHDWGYCSHIVPREQIDRFLFDGIRKHDEDKAERIHTAVKLFGGRYWEDSPEDVAYMQALKQKIIASGRNPSIYGAT